MTRWVAAALVVVLLGSLPTPVAGQGMESIARITKLRRMRAKARAARGPGRNVRRRPGVLLEFIPRMSPRFKAPTHLRPIAERLERCLDERVEVCVSVPPRHGKTTLLVHAIVHILLRDPTATILYASYAHNFAAKQVRKAMRLAVRAGIVLGDIQRQDEWSTLEGGGVKAAGVGGQITGEGFRLIIVDDPHKNRAEAESRRIRERVIDGFNDDIYTRQDPRGTSVFVVHTRWHEDDLIGYLTRPSDVEDVEPFEYVNLPAVRPSNDNDEGEEALAPWLFSMRFLRRMRARVGPYGWWSLYMGEPQPRTGRLFVDAVLVEELDYAAHDGFRYAIGVDLARTARTRSDHHAAVVMRLNLRTNWIDVVEVVRMQGALVDLERGAKGAIAEEGFIRHLHALQQKYPGARTVMYTGRDEEALLALLGGHEKFPCEVVAIPASADKWQRATPYGAAWRAGRIRLPREAKWTNDYVKEHAGFTGQGNEEDDQVDAGAAAFDALEGDGDRGFGDAMDELRWTA